MPRPQADWTGRREDVAEAVWRVLAVRGFVGLTMRAVAAELGATTGVLTHYFTGKKELTSFALELLDSRSRERARRSTEPGMRALRAALLDMLPLNSTTRDANRIWVASWDAALLDEAHRAPHAARYRDSRDRLAGLIRDAYQTDCRNGFDHHQMAEVLQSFVLGLIVQALLDPPAYPPERQIELVDRCLAFAAFAPASTASGDGSPTR